MTAERRRSMRVELAAPAALYAADAAPWACEVDNLSLGGASLEGARARTHVGDPVIVKIRLPGARSIRPHGRVARVRAVGGRINVAVEFDRLSADIEDYIEDACLAALERAGAPRVLVVDPRGLRCLTLARSLREAGHRVVPVATPLHAVAFLLERADSVAAVVVQLDLGQTTGAELLRYVADEYPRLRRVAVAGPENRAAALALVEAGLTSAAITTEEERPLDAAGLCKEGGDE
jgi:CheY-like chemotaxis protein